MESTSSKQGVSEIFDFLYFIGGVIAVFFALAGAIKLGGSDENDIKPLKQGFFILVVIASLFGFSQCSYDDLVKSEYSRGYQEGSSDVWKVKEAAYDEGYSDGWSDGYNRQEEEYDEASSEYLQEYAQDHYYDTWREEILEEYGIYE